MSGLIMRCWCFMLSAVRNMQQVLILKFLGWRCIGLLSATPVGWDNFIGPGRALDKDKFFVVCANALGGCYGSTGPSSLKPGSKQERYGGDFPWISALDVVRSQALLLDELGIGCLHGLIGASLGGIFALTFALEFPERAKRVIPIATAHMINSTQIAANFAQVESIHLDPNFRRGNYYEGRPPHHGLVLARQIAQMTFVDQDTLMERIGSEVHNPPRFPSYRLSHPVESYLRGNASRFVDRLDANSYLVMLDLWQRTDLRRLFNESDFSKLFSRCRGQEFLQFGIDSDFCFPLYQQRRLQRVLDEAGVSNGLEVVSSQKGHDSFLLEPELYRAGLMGVLC